MSALPDPFHRKPADRPADPGNLRAEVQLTRSQDSTGTDSTKRGGSICSASIKSLRNRLGRPEKPERQVVLAKLDPQFPARERFINAEARANCSSISKLP